MLKKFGVDRGGRRVAKAVVWPDIVVFVAEDADDNLCFKRSLQQFAVEALVAEAAVAALVDPVLPRAAGLDEPRDDAALLQPALEHAGR